MRLLIAETPRIAKALRDNNLIDHDTEIVFTYGTGLWRYTIPKISFSDIPFTFLPTLTRHQSHKPRIILVGTDGKSKFFISEQTTKEEYEDTLDNLVEYLRNQKRLYKEIICAVCGDREGYGSAKQLLDKLGWVASESASVYCLNIITTDKRSLEIAWADRIKNPWVKDSIAENLAQQQLIKNTFDYWWNTNSTFVIAELSTWSGLAATPLVSKDELMLLCMLADKLPIKADEIISLMETWKGSGKYAGDGCQGIGTPVSRLAIFEIALKRGALSEHIENGSNVYALSEAGRAFVSQLHKKTFDPDLPFRINDWVTKGDYEAMARYIRTIFGRQIRFQRNLRKAHAFGWQNTNI